MSRPGAALRSQGFHNFLAKFLGWELPEVQNYDGKMYPLYMQCIFPYFYIEQKRGWSHIEPPIPTHFRIREAHQRVAEFILNLDSLKIATKRLELEREEEELKRLWSFKLSDIKNVTESIGGIAKNLPKSPITTWPPQIMPIILLPDDDEWFPIDVALKAKKKTLRETTEKEIPKVAEISSTAEAELKSSQELLKDKESLLFRTLESYEMEKAELEAVQTRLQAINEDLRHNKDTKVLIELGSTSAGNLVNKMCPTCNQSILDSLAPIAKGQEVMSIDDNIAFLEEQRRTFNAVLKNSVSIIDARKQQINKLRGEISNLRNQIRAIRQTLVSDGRLPSKAAIRKQVILEEEINNMEESIETFSLILGRLEDLANKWATLNIEKQRLPAINVSSNDRRKLNKWKELLREQLSLYDFKSLPLDSITISDDSYRPMHEGFDLPTNISASDFIRIIWAYLNGLLEVSREEATNHPGLLIFDEPKQQSTKDISFEALLGRVATAAQFGQQVIFVTSENKGKLEAILETIPNTYYPVDGRIIKPIVG